MQVATRYAVRAYGSASGVMRRQMAIAATVKSAPDTSKKDFAAPSHASVAGDAADLTRQLRAYYSSSDSAIHLSEADRATFLEELAKRASSIPDSNISPEWVMKNIEIPATVRLGDNPAFSGKA